MQRKMARTSLKLFSHRLHKVNAPNLKLAGSASVWTANYWAAISPGLAAMN